MKRMAKRMQTQCSIIGTLAEESQVRKRDWIAYGSNIFFQKKDNQCRPLSFWTERDIWDYIELYKIPVSDLYGQGYQRNGCMFCGFGLCAERRKLCITRNFRRFIIAFPCVSQFSAPEGQRFESSRSHQKGCCTRIIPRAAAFSFYWDPARFGPLLGPYRIILSADAASEKCKLPSKKRRLCYAAAQRCVSRLAGIGRHCLRSR